MFLASSKLYIHHTSLRLCHFLIVVSIPQWSYGEVKFQFMGCHWLSLGTYLAVRVGNVVLKLDNVYWYDLGVPFNAWDGDGSVFLGKFVSAIESWDFLILFFVWVMQFF